MRLVHFIPLTIGWLALVLGFIIGVNAQTTTDPNNVPLIINPTTTSTSTTTSTTSSTTTSTSTTSTPTTSHVVNANINESTTATPTNATQTEKTPVHDNHSTNATECHEEVQHDHIVLASFRWHEIGVYFTITAFIIIAGFAKLGFHKLHWLSSKVPESCLLVLLGLAVSLLVYFTSGTDDPNLDPCRSRGFQFPQFSSKAFFLILLPPIILDSAYSLYDRVFLDNLGTVLVFAVIGTLFNVFAIGASLYGIFYINLIPHMQLTLTDALVFSSLISAVDPVAVLAIFQELGVNQNLYFLIFGESLLNDGVTVVLYNTMQAFRRMSVITAGQVILAFVSFFITSFGGVLIGIFYGLLTALMTKWTHTVRVVEPLALLGLAYLSYLTAELFHFSGIICLIVCGLIQAHFGFMNISHKSYICVKYFTKMASATSDTVIFMFLGMLLVNENHQWNTAFVIWSLVFCFIYRFLAVFILSWITNFYRTKSLGFEEQFIAAYGGLRGAVAFSLASTLDDDMPERNTYIFTTLIVILFTIFVQGITIKPLVGLLNIKKKSDVKKNLTEEITETGMDHVMAGIEEILGHHGDFYLRELIMHYNDKYLKKWLLHEESDTKLTRLFEKIALSEHYAHLYGPAALVEDNIKPLVDYPSKEKVSDHLLTSSLSITRDDIYGIENAEEKRKSIDSFANSVVRQNSALPDVEVMEAGEGGIPPPLPENRRRKKSFLRSRKSIDSKSSTPQPNEDEGLVLRKALRDNRYNKLHYKYNRNLVDEENQEMSSHLKRRAFNAHRMSTIASANYYRSSSRDLDSNHTRSKSVRFEALAKSLVLLERHRRRTFSSRERSMRMSSPSAGRSNEATPEKEDLVALLLQAQEDHIRKMAESDLPEQDIRRRTSFHEDADDDPRSSDIEGVDQSILRRPLVAQWRTKEAEAMSKTHPEGSSGVVKRSSSADETKTEQIKLLEMSKQPSTSEDS